MGNYKQEETTIISLHSGKGGSGKTSITANLGAKLAAKGFKTLVVDMDLFTRGLTFFLSKGKTHFNQSMTVRKMLEIDSDNINNLNMDLFEVRENLFLISVSENSLEQLKITEFDEMFHKRLLEFRRLIRNIAFRGKFKYVFIDARSGTDFLSIAPALIADSYWIVTEEDRTSQRASKLLCDAIREQELSFNLGNKFRGFIINMVVTSLVKELRSFFETTVFNAPCISIIPLNRKVRKAFIEDKLIIESAPKNVFSYEINGIVNSLTNSEFDDLDHRIAVQTRKKFINTTFPPFFTAYVTTIAISLIMLFGRDLGELQWNILVIVVAAVLAISSSIAIAWGRQNE